MRDLLHGPLEGLLVGPGRRAVPTHLAHELKGSGLDLFVRRRLRPPQRHDAPAHGSNLSTRRRLWEGAQRPAFGLLPWLALFLLLSLRLVVFFDMARRR